MTSIPRILHQTWKDATVPPAFLDYAQSWRRWHPGWEIRLWTDADLSDFVRTTYPALYEMFECYPHPIMRADVGRYLLLREFGGVYADLDSEALASFDQFADDEVPVCAYEPSSHVALEFIRNRGFARIVSNAIVISPPRHPFWDHLVGILIRCRHAPNPLDATGPFVFTAAVEQFPGALAPRVLPAHVFSPRDKFGAETGDDGSAHRTLAIHHWAGTWWSGQRPSIGSTNSRTMPVTQSDISSPNDVRKLSEVFADQSILVAVPVRDAADTLPELFRCILRLQYPQKMLSLAFLEGDSTDDSFSLLRDFQRDHEGRFARIGVIKSDTGVSLPEPRWDASKQQFRRGHIAKVRNELLRQALRDEDWVLWIDADIVDFSPGILRNLLDTGAQVTHPNAVRRPGGPSMDLNAWIAERALSADAVRKWMIDGLYQPPAGYQRLYLSDLRYRDSVALDSVGGTMLLVHADLHRSGLLFPAQPRDGLIETEAFARVAHERGVLVIGLPNVEVIHASR
jgi:hypothetical protein